MQKYVDNKENGRKEYDKEMGGHPSAFKGQLLSYMIIARYSGRQLGVGLPPTA